MKYLPFAICHFLFALCSLATAAELHADATLNGTTVINGTLILPGGNAVGPLASKVLPNDATQFLNGTGNFSVPGGGGGGGTVSTGNTLWVDAVNGNDSAAIRGRLDKPFLTLGAARTAANSGDTIKVLSGSYTTTISLAKNGVNWDFATGTSVSRTSTTDSSGIFDDGGASISYHVTGHGQFTLNSNHDGDAGLVVVSNSASNVTFEFDTLFAGSSNFNQGLKAAIFVTAGSLRASGRMLDGTAQGVWWTNGNCWIDVTDIGGNITHGVWGQCTASDGGRLWVRAQSIRLSAGGALPFYQTSTDPTAYMSLQCDLIEASFNGIAVENNGGKGYVFCTGKLVGRTECTGGLLYVNAPKAQAVMDESGGQAPIIDAIGGVLRANVGHIDPNGHTGHMISVRGGTLIADRLDFTSVGVPQISTVTVNGTPSAGSYFVISSIAGPVTIWFDVDGSGAAPGVNPTELQVNVSSSDSSDQVATDIVTAVNGHGWSATELNGVVTLTDSANGSRTSIADGGSATGFGLTTTQSGTSCDGIVMTSGTLTLRSSNLDCSQGSDAALNMSGGTATLMGSQLIGPPGLFDIAEFGATLNVSGGFGSGTSGHFNTSGTVNFLSPN